MLEHFSISPAAFQRLDLLFIDNINRKKMKNRIVEKIGSDIIVEILEYVPNSISVKTIVEKTTGNSLVVSSDSGDILTEKTDSSDVYIQIVNGKANVVINGISNLLATGESIIVPANTPNNISATESFTLISTIIKEAFSLKKSTNYSWVI